MTLKKPFLLLCLAALASCSTLDELKRGQSYNTDLLTQQAIRLEMQEENLAQLAESQQELAKLLDRLDMRTRAIEERLPDSQRQAQSNAPDAESAPKPVVDKRPSVPKAVPPTQTKLVVGRNEWVWLELLGRNLKARVDTGALSSSLSATDLLPFERDGRKWIRFRVPDEDHPEGGDFYEAPLVRYVRIRQASLDDLDRRPVVRLKVRLGDFIDDVEFNLSNRENMLYPVLLGRNFLRDVAMVDVAQKFTQPKFVPSDSSNPSK